MEKGDKKEIRALFSFDSSFSREEVVTLFNIWGRWFFPGHYLEEDASFHEKSDNRSFKTFRGITKYFVFVGFRGCAKTTRQKIWRAFIICNDLEKKKKYYKILTKDIKKAKQLVTDIYNMLINERVQLYYPELFRKTLEKREETMSSFTTSTGVKMTAGSVGTDQRGDQQGSEETARPDDIWFDDFETRKVLRSAIEMKTIKDNMEEARTGLSKGGTATYTCNYLSERGNVHQLIRKAKKDPENYSYLNVPIRKNGKPTWPEAYTNKEIDTIKKSADDYAGEYLGQPSAGPDVMFDRKCLKKQEIKKPVKVIADFKIFHKYDPSHRYGLGADVSGGIGLDSSTTTIIDFTTIPSKVVATFATNTLKPSPFGDEIESQANRFGAPIVAVENNKFDTTIERLRQLNYDPMYYQEMKATRVGVPPRVRTLGWNTNSDTKPKMLFALKKAVEDGHLELSDKDLIAELKSYTRDDLMDTEEDVRLTTRHFDKLISCAIAYMMKDYAEVAKAKSSDSESYEQEEYEKPTLE